MGEAGELGDGEGVDGRSGWLRGCKIGVGCWAGKGG